MNEKEIVNAIRAKRKSLHMTQKHLSDLTGISRYNIIMIERGKRSPTLSTLMKLCSELGMTFDLSE
jgi:transcriptional regulator with XRE-family HTH domain